MKKMTLQKFDQGHIKGSVEVSKTGVKTSGAISIGHNTVGSANGFVNFEDGFNFNYEATKLDFNEHRSCKPRT